MFSANFDPKGNNSIENTIIGEPTNEKYIISTTDPHLWPCSRRE